MHSTAGNKYTLHTGNLWQVPQPTTTSYMKLSSTY